MNILFEVINDHKFIYSFAVIVIGLLGLWIFRKKIKNIYGKHMHQVDNIKQFDAVKTPFPLGKTVKKQKEHVKESIETRFTIINRSFLFIYIIIWFILFFFPYLGKISATAISILATVMAVVIGIAARPFLENMIAGIVLTLSKQIHAGDTVSIDNQYGTIEDIFISHTVIKLWDWKRYIIPNSNMLGKEITCYRTKENFLWTTVEFWVSYNADMNKVEKLAKEAANNSEFASPEEPPKFWIMEMAKDGIKCWIAGWTKSPTDSWYFKIDVRKLLLKELQNEGIITHMHYFNVHNKH